MKTITLGFLVSFFLITTAAIHAQDPMQTTQLKSTAEIMIQPMNVFRRFSGDAKPIYDFYGKVLGLKQRTTYNLGGNTNVARFEIGTSQLKFTTVVSNRKYQQGALQDVTGLRLFTFFFPNQALLTDSFKDSGLTVPEFHPIPGLARSSALVQDPSGQWVEIVIAPGESSTVYNQIEIGLVVSNEKAVEDSYRNQQTSTWRY